MTLQPVWIETVFVKPFETDFLGRWKPHCFFQAMQTAATHHADHLGLGYTAMLARDSAWLLARLRLEILRSPALGETLTVHTWPRGLQQKIFFVRDFLLFSENGEKIAAATSAWLMVDMQARRILKPDPQTLAHLPDNRGRTALEETLEKIHLPAGMQERFRVRAGYAATDLMQHVNNTRYIEWASDCFSLDTYRRRRLESIQINYASEVRPGEEVAICTGECEDGTVIIAGEKLGAGERSFEMAWRWAEE